MSPEIKSRLEELLNEKIRSTKSVSGGCIADSRKIELFSGKVFFLKQLRSNNSDIFSSEAYGLELLSESETVSVPKVIYKNSDYLLLDWIEVGSQGHHSSMERLGYEFARLHKFRGEKFGLEIDNYLGKTPQLNTPTKKGSSHWSTFFIENRILFQVELAKKNGFSNPEFLSLIDNLINKIPDILDGTKEDPSLLHGDLWSGNYLIDVSGTPWLIDPAVYFGHREADLAMTSLFGGFNNTFYSAYNLEFPILPEYSDREPIYHLYHLINHLNLFGSSYYGQIISILKRYL
tara:strand:- start:1885 stop:2754 length:870 start_codon:yes stop_codon:yes gene_type:complete